MEADGQAVPEIDRADGEGEIGQLLFREMFADALENLVGNAGAGDKCYRFGPFEGSFFFFRK